MTIDSQQNKRIYALMVAKAWMDPAFEQQLRQNPKQTAIAQGMVLPNNVEVHLTSQGSGLTVDTSGPVPKLYLALPPRPTDLADDEIVEWQNTSSSQPGMLDFMPGNPCSSKPGPGGGGGGGGGGGNP